MHFSARTAHCEYVSFILLRTIFFIFINTNTALTNVTTLRVVVDAFILLSSQLPLLLAGDYLQQWLDVAYCFAMVLLGSLE